MSIMRKVAYSTQGVPAKFLSLLTAYSVEEKELILNAFHFSRSIHAFQLRDSGESFHTHPLTVAKILIKMKLDAASIAAALLHDSLEDTNTTEEELEQLFGREIVHLVRGVTNITQIKQKSRAEMTAENVRNVLLAMSHDIRVILIKLADRLHNTYTLSAKTPEKRKIIAKETYNIFAPIAEQLGISWLSNELKDLSLKHLAPKEYTHIEKILKSKKSNTMLHTILTKSHDMLKDLDIPVRIEVRSKSIHSIYEKMRHLDKKPEKIHDIFGLRIITNTEAACYQLLGIIHKKWMPLEKYFKDYIALPKANKYQSLHSTVIGPEGKVLEVQIRTKKMHQIAEHGVAAHWLYKQPRANRHSNLTLMKRVKQLSLSPLPPIELLEEIQHEILKENMYIFTPKGNIILLPLEATPIDFAYAIHTEIGTHAHSAIIDGKLSSLIQPLSNTQVVEIRTSNKAHPKLLWLQYAKTVRAKHNIRYWINHHQKRHTDQAPEISWYQFACAHLWVQKDAFCNKKIIFATCCNPAIGDEIKAYCDTDYYLLIHKKHCKLHTTVSAQQVINVEWTQHIYRVQWRFSVVTQYNERLFADIEHIAHIWASQLTQGKILSDTGHSIEAVFTMRVEHSTIIEAIRKKIARIPTVHHVKTLSEKTLFTPT